MCVTAMYLDISLRAPEREDLPEEDVGEALDSREGAVRRRRAASLHQSAENEQLLPRLGHVALPRAARGAVVAEERERALYHAGAAAKPVLVGVDR